MTTRTAPMPEPATELLTSTGAGASVSDLLVHTPTFHPTDTCADAVSFFLDHPEHDALPVVKDGVALGLLVRQSLLARFVRPFQHELYGRKGCTLFMDSTALTVDRTCSVAEIGLRIGAHSSNAIQNGFIIVDGGRYAGMSTGRALVSALAELQLTRSRQLLDSIQYARRIQRALLHTSDQELSRTLPNHRIRWEPRDTVGGDYYFCRSVGPRLLLVVLDCTGHGVPGALMTMIVTASLEAAVAEVPSLQPARILASVNRRIRHALSQKSDTARTATASPSDGMDAAVLLLDGETGELQFSGASIPLFVQLPGEADWMWLPAARGGVGYPEIPDSTEWPTSRHAIAPGLRFAMATDGVLDQIGESQRTAYGRKRLLSALSAGRELPLDALFTHTWLQLEEWRGRETQRDDMTLLMAEVPDELFSARLR